MDLFLHTASVHTSLFGAHSTHSASTSAPAAKGVPTDTVLKAAGWSGGSTFSKYYNNVPVADMGQHGPASPHCLVRTVHTQPALQRLLPRACKQILYCWQQGGPVVPHSPNITTMCQWQTWASVCWIHTLAPRSLSVL